MKRINSNTNCEFKRGDIREDGFIFTGYDSTRILKKTGYFREKWLSPDAFKNVATQHKMANTKNRATARGKATRLLSACKNSARRHNREFELTLDDILPRIEKGFCELTKLPFDFNAPIDSHTNPYSPSVDRIDSKKGYTKDNIRIILSSINMAINDHGLDKMLPIFKALSKSTLTNK